jgi:serine/threonine-protein kinase
MYMSPEQATGGYQIDLRSDVWSLGILLYRVLTGESPLPPTHGEIMVALAGPKELDLASMQNARIPPGAAAVVRRCLRKKREERYASAQELETDLRAALEEEAQRAGRPAKLGALLGEPSASVTVITAPLAQEGDLATVVSTAPTGFVGAEGPRAPASQVAHAATKPPAPREPLPSIPYVPTLASHAPRPAASRSRTRLLVAAGLVVASGGAIALWRATVHDAAPDTAAAIAAASGATTVATSNGAGSASSAGASSASSVASSDTAPGPAPAPDPTDRGRPRPSVRPKGAGLHPPPAKTSTPAAAAASTAPEPWRRPGF